MPRPGALPLPIVDARRLAPRWRDALRPGAVMHDRQGRARRLPRFFYEVDSWSTALELRLTPNFMLWEFIEVDVREVEALRLFPRFIPCAVTVLAAHLEILRQAVGTYVHISANGGYRSPSHRLSRFASPHCWGVAANIYLIGDDRLDNETNIHKYAQIATELLPSVWTRPYGPGDGEADDHLHIDLGYVSVVPRDAASDDDDDVSTEAHGPPPLRAAAEGEEP